MQLETSAPNRVSRKTQSALLILKRLKREREQSARKSRLGKDGLAVCCVLRLPVLSIHRRLKVCAPRQVAGSGVPPPPRRRPTDRRCASDSPESLSASSVQSVLARLPAKVHRALSSVSCASVSSSLPSPAL
jgi:hypothetical protein